MAMREIAELLAPAIQRAGVGGASAAHIAVEAPVLARVRALYAGAGAREQETRVTAAPATPAACA
jgi:hypothetical protein